MQDQSRHRIFKEGGVGTGSTEVGSGLIVAGSRADSCYCGIGHRHRSCLVMLTSHGPPIPASGPERSHDSAITAFAAWFSKNSIPQGGPRCNATPKRSIAPVSITCTRAVWSSEPASSGALKTRDLRETLKWRFHSALVLTCDARLFQIELALDASARLVGDFAFSKQSVDVFALGSNQFRPEVRGRGSGFDPI